MIRLALKKMIKNKSLTLSLFVGILVAIVISCTIPIYSQGIAHRMLVTQFENYQNENEISPATTIISCSLTSFGQSGDGTEADKFNSSVSVNNYNYFTNYLNNHFYPKLNMPPLVKSVTLSTTVYKSCDSRTSNTPLITDAVFKATDSYEGAIEIISGKMPEKQEDDEIIEVMISKATQAKTKYVVGTIINVGETTNKLKFNELIFKAKIVGVFDYVNNPYSTIIDQDTGIEFYLDYENLYDELLVKRNLISQGTWYYAGDFTKLDANNSAEIISAVKDLENRAIEWGIITDPDVKIPPLAQYEEYYKNFSSVNVLLVLFYAPVLILVIFFIFMISKFVVENDKNEISMLNSRGASRWQILWLYFLQGGTISIVCMIVAPFLALLLSNFLGATSGFLEFGQRAPIKLDLSLSVILFAFVAAILSVATMLIPVYRNAKIEIVQHKNRKRNPLIAKIILAVICVFAFLLTIYAYYVLVIEKGGLFTKSDSVQPLAYVFIISFFAAVALLFILIYPYILNFIIELRQKKWSADKFSAFSRISKLENKEKFIMVFLILTIAIGVFSSISARTLNTNMDKNTDYQYPCDIMADVRYLETPNRRYLFDDVDGIEATKITIGNSPILNSNRRNLESDIDLMGITPKEFSKLITWDDSILPQSMDEYMRQMQNDIKSCIISRNVAEKLNVKKGDVINVYVDETLSRRTVIDANIIEIVEAWPTYYPTEINEFGEEVDRYLIVLNNDAIDKVSKNQNYKVWMNTDYSVDELKTLTMTLGARADNNYDRVRVYLENIINGKEEQYLSQINSVRQATNGSLTLGFISVIFVCAIGLVVYWIISLKSRMLQIGTMRALGMSFKNVRSMVILEEILLCSSAIAVGLIAGVVSGVLFSPLFQSAFGEMGQMPPYVISINFNDIFKLMILITLLILISTKAVTYMLKRIKATTAIKLGEE